MVDKTLSRRLRKDYSYILQYRTRWTDNDMYGHMNNSIYYFLYDSIINSYLISHCSLEPSTSSQYGLVAHSQSDFFAPIAYPAVAELALRVNRLGKSSVTYEVALFEHGVEEVKSVAEIVHVFVDRTTVRPALTGMSDTIRTGLQKIQVQDHLRSVL